MKLLEIADARPDRALKPEEVAALTGFAVKSLANWRSRGFGPPFITVGGRIRYMQNSTLDWLRSHRESRSTSDRSTPSSGPNSSTQ